MSDITSLKIDGTLLADLEKVAAASNTSPHKHLRTMIDQEMLRVSPGELSKDEMAARRAAILRVEASEALEGYTPITDKDIIALQEKWVRGELSVDEEIEALDLKYGVKR